MPIQDLENLLDNISRKSNRKSREKMGLTPKKTEEPEKKSLLQKLDPFAAVQRAAVAQGVPTAESKAKEMEAMPEFIKKAGEKLVAGVDAIERARQKIAALPPEAGTGERLGAAFSEFPEAASALISGNFEIAKPFLSIIGGLAAGGVAGRAVAKVPAVAKGLAAGKLTARTTTAAVGGAAFATGAKVAKLEKPSVREAAETAAFFGALPVAGKVLKLFGGKALEAVLPRTVREAKLVQRAKAGIGEMPRTVAKTAAERGIAGTESMIGVQSTKKASKIFTKEINPALAKVKEKLSKKTLFSKLDKIVAKETEPGRRSVLQKGLDALKKDYIKIRSKTYTEWQKVKSSLDDFIPKKAFKGEDVASGYNQMRFELANAIRSATYNKFASQTIKSKYIDYGNLLELQKIGIVAQTGTKLRGGFFTGWHALWDKIVTPVGTVGGQTLYQIGRGLEFVAPAGIKTVGEGLVKKGITKSEMAKVFKP